jgi:hypothetical protein
MKGEHLGTILLKECGQKNAIDFLYTCTTTSGKF